MHDQEPIAPPRALHVAVCFFGLLRSLNYTVDSIRSHVLDPLLLSGTTYDVYVHTYNDSSITNARNAEFGERLDWTHYRLLHPHAAVIEDARAFESSFIERHLPALLRHGDAWGQVQPHTSLRNLLKQLHSLRAVTRLWVNSSARYDAIIYVRPDVWFFKPLDAHAVLAKVAAATATNECLLLTPPWHTFGGLNDRFAIGTPAAMKRYGERVLHVLRYSTHAKLHSESFLSWTMRCTSECTCGAVGVLFTRVRAGGVLWMLPDAATGALRCARVQLQRNEYNIWALPQGEAGAAETGNATEFGGRMDTYCVMPKPGRQT